MSQTLDNETKQLKKKNKHKSKKKHHKKHSQEQPSIPEGIDKKNKNILFNMNPPIYPYIQTIMNPGFIPSNSQNIYNIPLNYSLLNPGIPSYPYTRIKHLNH